MKLNTIILTGLTASLTLGSVIPPLISADTSSHKRPIVIWHGMGDRYDSASIHTVVEEIKSIHKDIQVHVVRLDEDGSEDQKQTVLGVVNEQVRINAAAIQVLVVNVSNVFSSCFRLIKYVNN